MQAFSDTVSDFDAALSHRRQVLWKWNMGALLASLVAIICLVIPVLGWLVSGLLLLLLPFASLAISILYLIYLYRTAQLFRENSIDWLMSRAAASASRY